MWPLSTLGSRKTCMKWNNIVLLVSVNHRMLCEKIIICDIL